MPYGLLFTCLILLGTSRVALTVRIQPFVFPEKAVVGTKVSVMCTTVEEIPTVQFRWYKNGSPLVTSESNSRVRLRTFPDVSNLVIGPLEEGDSGNYTCTGTTKSRSDSHTEVLSVLVPPKWIHEPQDANLREGQNLSVRCEAKGHPTPTVQWKLKGNRNVAMANDSRGGLLTISKATKDVAGTYVCTADNGLPDKLSREIRINIFGENSP
ncbi:conserved hypothetical protein [Ixodes scapularis]|uniref:Ig-like domain-containing protein n=1 Tax=Ixodes scapularis TaxID=6945 RepID=B7P6H9_IXOSC|nr:conserved hypothetical protein [Ixodes scapularis]|eukprot:XP_002408804.1 conserved hypothetical protein [Ixodes scapularis]